jgi:hypothetical protein
MGSLRVYKHGLSFVSEVPPKRYRLSWLTSSVRPHVCIFYIWMTYQRERNKMRGTGQRFAIFFKKVKNTKPKLNLQKSTSSNRSLSLPPDPASVRGATSAPPPVVRPGPLARGFARGRHTRWQLRLRWRQSHGSRSSFLDPAAPAAANPTLVTAATFTAASEAALQRKSIYVLPEEELRGLSPDLYIPRIGPHNFMQQN